MVVKKKRRKLKKEAIGIIFILILFVYMLFNVPVMLDNHKLGELGYDKEAISAIKKYKLKDQFIEQELFSEYLNDEIKNENFRIDDLELYLNDQPLNDDEWKLYDKLATNYTIEERVQLFKTLDFKELTPLLVFDDIDDINNYISDVTKNRFQNSDDSFILDNSYSSHYVSNHSVINEGSYTMLVNKHYKLSKTFVPSDLVDMSIQYASKNRQLDATAYESFTKMCDVMHESNLRMYAFSTYRSYDYQVELYDTYANRDGVEAADTYSARPGYSEHQTGLALDVATASAQYSEFKDTPEYTWLIDNAHLYGWILRYPENKESITGFSYEPWHWRYVGVDIATEIYNSKLTFDEYSALFIFE